MGFKINLSVLFHFLMKFLYVNSTAPDDKPHSLLGQYCLPMSQKWDARLVWVKTMHFNND